MRLFPPAITTAWGQAASTLASMHPIHASHPCMQVGDKIQYIKIVEGAENLKNANY